jgi:hypothetical protein
MISARGGSKERPAAAERDDSERKPPSASLQWPAVHRRAIFIEFASVPNVTSLGNYSTCS